MSKEAQNDDVRATAGSANSGPPIEIKDHFKDSPEGVKNNRPSQPSNCHIVKKVSVDIIIEIGDHLPQSAKICLQNTRNGLLNRLRHSDSPETKIISMPITISLIFMLVLLFRRGDRDWGYWLRALIAKITMIKRGFRRRNFSGRRLRGNVLVLTWGGR